MWKGVLAIIFLLIACTETSPPRDPPPINSLLAQVPSPAPRSDHPDTAALAQRLTTLETQHAEMYEFVAENVSALLYGQRPGGWPDQADVPQFITAVCVLDVERVKTLEAVSGILAYISAVEHGLPVIHTADQISANLTDPGRPPAYRNLGLCRVGPNRTGLLGLKELTD